MKLFKVAVAIACATNAFFCAADYSANGPIDYLTVTDSSVQANGSVVAKPSAMVVINGSNSVDPGCAFFGYRLPDLSDQFQKAAYGTLLTAQINGTSVAITFVREAVSYCRVTSATVASPH